MDAIFTRRSIRKYTDEDVTKEQEERLLRAAMAAPSAGNQQPWHFIVLRDRKTLMGVMDFHPYAPMLDHAPLAIAVCADPSLERFKGFWPQDCSAATENILVEAEAMGLGAVWLGIHPIEERVLGMRRLLNIPEGVIPMALVAIGHPDESKEPSDRYDDSRVHREKWQAEKDL
ncbi:MAG: nitroreductase family protein [Candidatus Sumerlaeota bacterium]